MQNSNTIWEYTSIDNVTTAVNELLSVCANIKESQRCLLKRLGEDFERASNVWEVATISEAISKLISDYNMQDYFVILEGNDFYMSRTECYQSWLKNYVDHKAILKNIFLYYRGIYEIKDIAMIRGFWNTFHKQFSLCERIITKLKLSFPCERMEYLDPELYLCVIDIITIDDIYNLSDKGVILPYKKCRFEMLAKQGYACIIDLSKLRGPQYMFIKSESGDKYILYNCYKCHREFYKERRKEWDGIRSELATMH